MFEEQMTVAFALARVIEAEFWAEVFTVVAFARVDLLIRA